MPEAASRVTPSGVLNRATGSVAKLVEISALCRSKPSSRATWVETLELLRQVVSYDAATLYLYDEERQLREAAQVDGVVRPQESNARESGVATADKGSLMAVRNAWYRPPTFGKSDQQDDFLETISAALSSEDKVLGMVSLGRFRAVQFDELDRQLVMLAAELIAGSMQPKAETQEAPDPQAAPEPPPAIHREAVDVSAVVERLVTAGELAASINHQINNPLAVIVGNVQFLLLANRTADEKTLSRLKVIEKAALKISDVNKKLMNINRLIRDVYPDGDPVGTSGDPRV